MQALTSTLLRRGLVALCALTFALPVQAHTSVPDPIVEGRRELKHVRIGHGCEDGPVRRQSVVFPTEGPVLTSSDPLEAVVDLSEVIVQGSLAGLVRAVQDRSIFARQAVKRDANENVVGFEGTRGELEHDLVGYVPFEFLAPVFVANSCAMRLDVELAIADLCSRGRNDLDPALVNLWIPDDDSAIAEAGRAAGVEGIGAAGRLVVLRDLQANPLPNGCGEGFVLTVTPSPEQVDRDLPMGRWPR